MVLGGGCWGLPIGRNGLGRPVRWHPGKGIRLGHRKVPQGTALLVQRPCGCCQERLGKCLS